MAQQFSNPANLSSEMYHEQTCRRLCLSLLEHYPTTNAFDRFDFCDAYLRYALWYYKENVNADDDLFFYFLFTLQLPRSTLVKEDSSHIYMQYIRWFVAHEFDQRNRFHNGCADDLDPEPGPARHGEDTLLLDCLEYLALQVEQEQQMREFRESKRECLTWCRRTEGAADQLVFYEKQFAHWASTDGRLLEANPLLRYVQFIRWFAENNLDRPSSASG